MCFINLALQPVFTKFLWSSKNGRSHQSGVLGSNLTTAFPFFKFFIIFLKIILDKYINNKTNFHNMQNPTKPYGDKINEIGLN